MNCAKFLITAFVLTLLGSCSFNDMPSSARAQFTMPNLQRDERPLATYACLNVWGPDGRWNSQIKTMSRSERALSVEFEVPYLWVGRQYTFRVLGFNTDPSQGSSSYTCPTGAPSAQINELGILENKLITKEITQVIVSAKAGLSSGEVCGLDLPSSGLYNCYSPSFISTHSSTAKLIDGTTIRRVNSGNPDFKVWMDESQTKMLRPNGLWQSNQHWQRALKPTGREFKPDTDPLPYFFDMTNIAGRTCPKNAYLNNSKMKEGDCLYYTPKIPSTSLTSSSGTEAEDFLSSWGSPVTGNGVNASYYEGNIKRCNSLGMRLPTLFEFRLDPGILPSNVPDDAQPIPDTINGIPTENGGDDYLTATAATGLSNTLFFMVRNSPPNIETTKAESLTSGNLICVLPSNEE